MWLLLVNNPHFSPTVRSCSLKYRNTYQKEVKSSAVVLDELCKQKYGSRTFPEQ